MPPTTQNNQSLDPAVVALAQAVRQEESGGNPTTSGKSGEYGAYQWEPGTWAKQAAAAGVDVPLQKSTLQQQNQVWYTWAKGMKDKGYTPGQIASMQNAGQGEPDAYTGKFSTGVASSGKNAEGVEYNVPKYVNNVMKYYQQYKSQGLQPAPSSNEVSVGYQPPAPAGQSQPSQSGNTAGYAPPTPPQAQPEPSPSATGGNSQQGFLQGLQEDLQGTNPESAGTQIENTVKGVGNFLFPAVGDIYNDVTGKNKKTALQQVGDVALTALPFIPGLGEVGEAARGADVAAQGVGAVAKSGLLSQALKGAGVGYGAGVASNLSQGQSIGQAVTPNAANIGGAVLGGAAPAVLKGLGGVATKLSGIDPQIQTKLTQLGVEGNPENANLYDKYMAAAKAHATNGEVPAPENIAADNIDQASAAIDKQTSQAGKEVGAANKAAANTPINPDKIQPLADSLNQGLDSFGYKVGTHPNGTLDLVPTRESAIPLNAQEQARILDVAKRIESMGNNGNVRTADDLMTVLDTKHDYGMTGQDPLQALFGQVRHNVNEVAREASPEFGAANDKLSQLKELQGTIKQIAGNRLQRGELLMRRMFGNNPGESQELFQKIKQATGVDLYKHAVLARHAIESVGSKADKSALQQMIEGSTKGSTGLLGAAMNIAGGTAKKTFANPETIGRNLVKGKKSGLLQDVVTKGAARVGAAL